MFSRKREGRPYLDFVNSPFMLIAENDKIQEVNQAFCDLISLRKEDLEGQLFHNVNVLTPLKKNIRSAFISKKKKILRYNINDNHFEASIFPFSDGNTHYLTIFLYEITPFLEIEKQLLKRNKELMIINTLSGAFISSENIEEVFNELLEKILMITDFTTGWIMFNDHELFTIRSHHGISNLFLKEVKDGKLSELCRTIQAMSDPLCIFEEAEINDLPVIKKEGIVILAAIPVKIATKLRGILFLASRAGREFDFNLASILSLIGSQLTLIVEKIELFDETRRLSITDSLTDLFNSRHFYQALDREIARAKRYKQIFSLAIFDIDDFKALNDSFGHQAGDEVLRNIALILQGKSRDTDIVARYGGEEFVIILPNTPKNEAFAVAERILKGVYSYPFLPNNNNGINVTISGGISSFPMDGTDAKDLLYCADMAMYKAKSSGKKQVVCYNVTYEKGI